MNPLTKRFSLTLTLAVLLFAGCTDENLVEPDRAAGADAPLELEAGKTASVDIEDTNPDDCDVYSQCCPSQHDYSQDVCSEEKCEWSTHDTVVEDGDESVYIVYMCKYCDGDYENPVECVPADEVI